MCISRLNSPSISSAAVSFFGFFYHFDYDLFSSFTHLTCWPTLQM